MSITFKASSIFFFMWAILAMVSAVIELQYDPSDIGGSSSAFESFVNRTANPEEVNITDPNVGYQSTNPVSTVVSYGKMAAGWLQFMAKAAMLDSPIFEGWTQPIRYILMALSAPFLMSITLSVASMFAGFVGGIFGRAAP